MNEVPNIVSEVSTAVTNRPSNWRAGQAAFNALYALRPDLANQIQRDHVNLDPFYRDENLPAFYEWLKQVAQG